ncbi:hypothetical protein J4E83_007227 [Alternaria metachromatica]|uniref:uncharacterized protein n=1 Tax=Alternaria metachromatica TaxID=283354 RepID=UPI0020C56AD0|nr:uncharacterized protein J4E83_007227 [Alternaria metachromatica]KAI4614573.1 hypothetical protein J4E83_007227 [Alternaria metachromatica]
MSSTHFIDGYSCTREVTAGGHVGSLHFEADKTLRRNEGGPVGPGKQTNQRAELKAVLIALQKASNKVDVLVRTDSQYAAQAVTEWYYDWRIQNWKKPEGKHRQNEHLIEQIVTLMKRRARLMVTTEFTWVKGHSGDPGNEAADALASAGSR